MGIDRSGSRALRSFVNNTLPTKIVAKTEEIALYALEKAIDISPIASGWFAASWRIQTTDTPTVTLKGERSREMAHAEALAESSNALASLKFGQAFYLTNGAPHATYVEYGSPTVTPHYISRRVAQAVGGKFGRINL